MPDSANGNVQGSTAITASAALRSRREAAASLQTQSAQATKGAALELAPTPMKKGTYANTTDTPSAIPAGARGQARRSMSSMPSKPISRTIKSVIR